MSRKSLESQIAELNHELELSTFLNKGVLQSNSEFKLRIAELEQENKVLRTAESRLARTEDKLDSAEKRVKDLTKELKERQKSWDEEMRGVMGGREGLEREVEGLKAQVRSWRAIGEKVGVIMQAGRRREEARGKKAVEGVANDGMEGNEAGPSRTHRSTKAKTPINQIAQAGPSTRSSGPTQLSSPITLPSSRTRKRPRRIDSGEDSEEEDVDELETDRPISSPVSAKQTPKSQIRSADQSNRSKRTSQGQSSAKQPDYRLSGRLLSSGRKSEVREIIPDFVIKIEKDSPKSIADSEDDPLALD